MNLETGEVMQQARLEPACFAERLTEWKDRLIQLTWQNNTGFVYDLASFKLQRPFRYPGEGSGVTNDGEHEPAGLVLEWTRWPCGGGSRHGSVLSGRPL